MRWTGAGLVLVIVVLAGCGSSGSFTSSPSPDATARTSARRSTPTEQTPTEQMATTQAAPVRKTVSDGLEPCDVLTMKDAGQLYPMLSSSELRAGGSNFDHPQGICLFGSEPNVSFGFIGGSPAPDGSPSADAAWEKVTKGFQRLARMTKSGEPGNEADVQDVPGLGERAVSYFFYFPYPADVGGTSGRKVVWEQDGATASLSALGPHDLPSERLFLEVAEELATRF